MAIGYLAKFQVLRWTVESRSPEDGTRVSHGRAYARKTGGGRVEVIGKLKRSHGHRKLFGARECRRNYEIRTADGRAG
jgi:hypothetical protein